MCQPGLIVEAQHGTTSCAYYAFYAASAAEALSRGQVTGSSDTRLNGGRMHSPSSRLG
jgi:hypothetical protein